MNSLNDRRTTMDRELSEQRARHRLLARPGLRLGALVLSALVAVAGSAVADEHNTVREAGASGGSRLKQSESSSQRVLSRLAESENEVADAPPIIAYVPSRGRGGARATAGAGTRGVDRSSVALKVLAPQDHVALTTNAQPTLYWFVSGVTDRRIEFTLIDEASIEPLLELTLPGPIKPGIQALDLSKHGITLKPGEKYEWSVAVIEDENRRSIDLIATGQLEWTEASADLKRSLEGAKWSYAPYATSGIWYDAMHELLTALKSDPSNERLLLQRSAFLEQAELSQVALHSLHSDR